MVEPAQRNRVNVVPAGAAIVAIDVAPRGTLRDCTTLAVISPRMPGPSGSHARVVVMPRVAKSSNAVLLNRRWSD
jgi:hypothetical protein